MSEFLDTSLTDGVLTVTLNRPGRRNALSTPICEGLAAIADEVARDIAIRCVVITGAGESFSAGADLKERRERDEAARWRYVEGINRAMASVEAVSVPVIAAVNGYCLGGGVELLLATDYRIAARTATFGLPETGLGIIPAGSIVRFAEEGLRGAGALMTYTAERFGASDALGWGLVDELADDAEATRARAAPLATRIARNAPLALRAAKRLRRALAAGAVTAGMRVGEEARRPLDATEDCLEGLAAFAEKRAAVFVGR